MVEAINGSIIGTQIRSVSSAAEQREIHPLVTVQAQLSSLKNQLAQPSTSTKNYYASLQWNLENAQRDIDRGLEEAEGRRRLPKLGKSIGLGTDQFGINLMSSQMHVKCPY